MEGLCTTKESAVFLLHHNITLWFAIALAEIRTRWILREMADCEQSTVYTQESKNSNIMSAHTESNKGSKERPGQTLVTEVPDLKRCLLTESELKTYLHHYNLLL